MKKNSLKNAKFEPIPDNQKNTQFTFPNHKQTSLKINHKAESIPGLDYEESSPLFKEATDPTFLTNEDEIQQMENDLLNLVNEFNSGKHNAFDQTLFEKMDKIRDQQESLAKSHFELNVKQETTGAIGIDASRTVAEESMASLMEDLNNLSNSLHQLYEVKDPETNDRGERGLDLERDQNPADVGNNFNNNYSSNEHQSSFIRKKRAGQNAFKKQQDLGDARSFPEQKPTSNDAKKAFHQ